MENQNFTSNATVLYVEDNNENRMLVRRILQAEGYSILEAANAAEALDIIQDHTPELILMDINMPDVDGYTFTTQLRKEHHLQSIPIIALTANVMKGDRERSLEAGCDGYIQKPIDVDNFSKKISYYLTRGRKQ